jgi:hypothetical protein
MTWDVEWSFPAEQLDAVARVLHVWAVYEK